MAKSMWHPCLSINVSAACTAKRCIKLIYTAMQSPQTITGSRMYWRVLNDFMHGTVTGCHFCCEPVCEISALLDFLKVLLLWNGSVQERRQLSHETLGLTLYRVELRRGKVLKDCLFSATSLTTVWNSIIIQEIGFHGWVATHRTQIPDSEAVETFSRIMNHTSLSGSTMEEFGFGRCQEKAIYWNACSFSVIVSLWIEKGISGWVKCEATALACTEPWLNFDWEPGLLVQYRVRLGHKFPKMHLRILYEPSQKGEGFYIYKEGEGFYSYSST